MSATGLIGRYLPAALMVFSTAAIAAECTLYETSHPVYPLSGAHLSTGKCGTCASCHVRGIWTGTPRTCIGCHNGDPLRPAVTRSSRHLPTGLIDCAGCHNTTAFNSRTGITRQAIHSTAASMRCDSCHNGSYTAYGAEGKHREHVLSWRVNGVTVLVNSVDCGYCHSTRTWGL